MRATVVVLLGLTVCCTTVRAGALADIRTLRSLSAETAEVMRLQAQHGVTATYAAGIKQEAREELQSTARSASTPQLKQMAQQAIRALDRNDAPALADLVQRLLAMEGPHGRAD